MKGKRLLRFLSTLTVAIAGAALVLSDAGRQKETESAAKQSAVAVGALEVSLTPQPDDRFEAGRMLIDKTYEGALVGRGIGQMLSVRTAVKGSAGYVAIERFTGTLDGRSGSFALQHVGFMNRGAPSLEVIVIPDSGTDELAGISGAMKIDQSSGTHRYEFVYSLGTPPDAIER